MNPIHITRHGHYIFGSNLLLSEGHLKQIVCNIKRPSAVEGRPVLGGRRPLIYTWLDGIGSVVLKTYGRGGIIRHINKQWYMRLGKPRCQKEFENIIKIRSLGISAPEPIAFAYSRGLFYMAWLILRKIRDHQTLADLSITDKQQLKNIMDKVANQVKRLINSRIYHVDLHPGNILVAPDNTVFIIDFDKAYLFRGDRTSLQDKYMNRWQRAVNKHGLPRMLSALLREGLY